MVIIWNIRIQNRLQHCRLLAQRLLYVRMLDSEWQADVRMHDKKVICNIVSALMVIAPCCCFPHYCQSGFTLWMPLDSLWSVLKCVVQLWCWPGEQKGLVLIFRQRNAVYSAHLRRGIHWPRWHTAVVLHLCVLAGCIKHDGHRLQLFCTSEDFQHHGELRKGRLSRASHTHIFVAMSVLLST